uniref:ATM interactor-like n=1 Tax=Styela clava TaxID=7725 RepID=UPI001939704C|nr:ATM interactor-like [Styela clava]
MSSSSEGITAEKISCPSKECKKTFKNATALEFHIQVMHNMCNNNNTKVINASKYGGKEGKARKYFCPNMNCTHRSQDKDLLPFKTYQALRQHYFTHHAEKNLPCTKCHKKFAEASLRDKHERNCNIKFVCSCGIAYRGKRGFMSHLSLSKHECPSALKEYFMPKKLKRIQQNQTLCYLKREKKRAQSQFCRKEVSVLCLHQ